MMQYASAAIFTPASVPIQAGRGVTDVGSGWHGAPKSERDQNSDS
ncbi:hypothetical protein [Sulfitobacter sp.]